MHTGQDQVNVVEVYLSYKFYFFPVIILLTNHEAFSTYILCGAFEPISALFTITGL